MKITARIFLFQSRVTSSTSTGRLTRLRKNQPTQAGTVNHPVNLSSHRLFSHIIIRLHQKLRRRITPDIIKQNRLQKRSSRTNLIRLHHNNLASRIIRRKQINNIPKIRHTVKTEFPRKRRQLLINIAHLLRIFRWQHIFPLMLNRLELLNEKINIRRNNLNRVHVFNRHAELVSASIFYYSFHHQKHSHNFRNISFVQFALSVLHFL